MKTATPALKTAAWLAGAVITAHATWGATFIWNNSAGDQKWSTAANWNSSALPGFADDVLFTNAASGPLTSANNQVDSAFSSSIASLRYAATNQGLLAANGHNTFIPNSLSVTGSVAGDNLYVGASTTATDGSGYSNAFIYATIQGPGSLNVSNPNGAIRVIQGVGGGAGGTGVGPKRATLDLSGLTNFSADVSGLYVAADTLGGTATPWDRCAGTFLMAVTNNLTLRNTNAPGWIVGELLTSHSLTASSTNLLGLVNNLNVDGIRIGGALAQPAAYVYFNPLFVGSANPVPSLRLRGVAGGSSRVTTFSIGDDIRQGNQTTTSSGSDGTGNLLLQDGTLDALVDTLFIGRSTAQATAPGGNNPGIGTLTINNPGTLLDVNQVELGYQVGAYNNGFGRGFLNVYTGAVMKVNNYIRLGYTIPNNTNATIGTASGGQLNISGGTVQAANLIDGVMLPDGRSTFAPNNQINILNGGLLDMFPAGAAKPGNIGYYGKGLAITIGAGGITNWDTISASAITTTLNPFWVYAGEALSPFGTNVGNMLVRNDLVLSNAALKLDVGSPGDSITAGSSITIFGKTTVAVNPTSGFIGGGSYLILNAPTLSFTGDPTNDFVVTGAVTNSRYSLSFDMSSPGLVNLNVGGGVANLTWSGDGTANVWDTRTTKNWNAGAGPKSETFYAYDSVTFDDSGSANPAINLVGDLSPAAVTVNSSQNYTLGGSGKITGFAPLNISGGGTLTVLTTNDNTGVTYSTGNLQVGNGTTADGSLGTGEIQSYGTLVFNAAGAQNVASVISGGSPITKAGPGSTLLGGSNTFYGTVLVQQGTLRAGNITALGDMSSGTTVTNGGTLDVNGFALTAEPITVSGAGVGGAGALVNNGANQPGAAISVTLAGDTTVGGSGRLDITNGLAGNGFKLTKMGANMVSDWSPGALDDASATNSGLTDIDIQAGVLRFMNGVKLGTTGAATVRSGGTLELYFNTNIINTKSLVLNGGACLFGVGTNVYGGSITLNGTNTFDVPNATSSLSIPTAITGTGSLFKGVGSHPGDNATTSTGVGLLVLSGINTFSGDLTISNGTVVLSNNGSVASAANLTLATGTTLNASNRLDNTLALANGQALRGSGTVVGLLSAPVGSTVAPGISAIGTLNVTGAATLRGTAVMEINKTGTTLTADKLAVTGALNLGGTLTVTRTGGALAAGDTFTLFSGATLANAFTTVNLPPLGPGLGWTNKTAIDGTLQVVNLGAPRITTTITASSLALSWPLGYANNYILQGQTNPLSIGLSANWAPVPGVVGNQIVLPITPANATVFYRLINTNQ